MTANSKKPFDSASAAALPMSIWGILFVGLSLLYIIGLSFLQRGEGFRFVMHFNFNNYAKLFNEIYLKSLLLSLKLAFQTALICFLLGYPFAYFLANTSPKIRQWLMLLIIVPFWTNALIRIYGWRLLFNANGPINEFLKFSGLIDKPLKLLYTNGAVLTGMVYAMIPFMILPVYSSCERMDYNIVDAARDLGASPFKAFLTVTIPMTFPGILAGLVLTFIPSIGLFFISDLLGGSNTILLGNLVHDELLKSRDMPFAATLSVLLLSMTFLVILLYRKLGGKTENMAF